MTQRRVPVFLTKAEMLAVLADLKAHVELDDSFEGSFSYQMPWNTLYDPVAVDDPPNGFRVMASYRIGNSMGQGGLRMIGEWADIPEQAVDQ